MKRKSLKQHMDECEHDYIKEMLVHVEDTYPDGKRISTILAMRLGISITTIYHKLKYHNIIIKKPPFKQATNTK